MHSVVRSPALKFCIPFGIHVCLALPLLWTRMQSPFWWPILGSLPGWCYLQYRRIRGGHRTGRRSAALYCGAVLLIPAAIIRDDDWLSLFALWLLMAYLAAIAVNRRGGSVSLTISLVWLLLAGLPPAWTEWLAESATGWLSRLLVIRSLQAGGSVWLEGLRVVSSAQSFDVAAFCTGSWGLGGMLAVCWWLQAWRCTTLIHALLVLSGTVCAALSMTVAAVWLVAWGFANDSWWSRFPWLVSWSTFVVVGACTFALDYAVFWFTAPIEDASRADSPQKNPVTEWWNRQVSGWNIIDKRPPEPLRVLSFSVLFRESFLAWRQTRYLPGFAPICILLIFSGVLLQSGLTAVWRDAPVVSKLQKMLEQARTDGDSGQMERTLNTLNALHPENPETGLQLVELLLQTQRRAESQARLQDLRAGNTSGQALINLWIAKNRLSDCPLLLLRPAAVIALLQQIPERDPAAEAAVLLGQTLRLLGSHTEARLSLAKAARAEPRHSVELLRSEVECGLPVTDVGGYLRLIDALRSQRDQHSPEPTKIRSLRLLQVLLGQAESALRELQLDHRHFDQGALRTLEAELRVCDLRRRMKMPDRLLLDTEIRELVQVREPVPDLPIILDTACELSAAYGWQPAADVATDLQQIAQSGSLASTPRRRALLSLLQGDRKQAIEHLLLAEQAGVILAEHELTLLLRGLREEGRQPESAAVMDRALQQLNELSDVSVTDRLRRLTRLQAAAGFFAEARSHCAAQPIPELTIFAAEIDLQEFDSLTGYSGELAGLQEFGRPVSDESIDRLLSLLQAALDLPSLRSGSARRLFVLRGHSSACRKAVEDCLLQRRIQNRCSDSCWLLLGRIAMQAGQTEDAISWLEIGLRAASEFAPEALLDFSHLVLNAGDLKRIAESRRLLEQTLRRYPQMSRVVLKLAEVQLALQDTEAAAQTLRNAEQLVPDNAELKSLQEKLGEAERAAKIPP